MQFGLCHNICVEPLLYLIKYGSKYKLRAPKRLGPALSTVYTYTSLGVSGMSHSQSQINIPQQEDKPQALVCIITTIMYYLHDI